MPELARCTSAVAIAEEATTPKATFYDWVTPVGVTESSKIKKSRRKLAVALSHPVLRAVVSNEQEPEERREEQQRQQFTPLSKRVATENLARDARIGEAYAARREQLKKAGKLFEVVFDKEGPLGFKILLARGQRSTRRRVVVDATFETCIAFNVIRPRDEIVAVDGDLLIEMDPEAFAELVRRLRNKRPLALTFAKGEGRDKAFREQCEEAGRAARLLQTSAVVNTIQQHGLPRTAAPEDDSIPAYFCGAFCADESMSYWECNLQVNDADYASYPLLRSCWKVHLEHSTCIV